ncbi:MAG TPA: 6-bladed beta-propeller [Terriglobales bacterium]|jgi:sugar lactone lactonase YvrE
MLEVAANSVRRCKVSAALVCVVALVLACGISLHAKQKKQAAPPPKKDPNPLEVLDYSKIVWPNPPAIARIKYSSQFFGEKRETAAQQKSKEGWMDRLAGVTAGDVPQNQKLFFQLVTPYGVGVDSKGRIYTADEKVRAVFIYNPETKAVEMIKNGFQARFHMITGVTLDDGDRLFVSDSDLHHVLVFDKQNKVEASIGQGMAVPAGMAVDNENRFLYVADTGLDQVLVYDADPPYKFLRSIGTRSGKHDLTGPGDFSYPTNVAVDADGSLFVSDTFNNRIEVFDAEGKFIRTFGKAGDGPGYFARPKGIAVDSDGHVWVADAVQNRVQVFTPEGRLLIWMGGNGLLPGQFSSLAGLAIDKNNRVVTSEQYPGRVQIFRYVTDAEAKLELAERDAVAAKKKAAPTTKEAVVAKPEQPTPK